MPSRWDFATCGWRRRVFHYPPPTLMSRNFRLPCAIELQPLSLTPLKMRKVEFSAGHLKLAHSLRKCTYSSYCISPCGPKPPRGSTSSRRCNTKLKPRWDVHLSGDDDQLG